MREILDTLLVTCMMITMKLLHIMPPKLSAYVKTYDSTTKWMYFLIWYGELLEKYNDIWNKVSNSIKTEFDSEPI